MTGSDRKRGIPFRALAVITPALIGTAVLLFLSPVPQDPAYHDFADRREFLGIPFFGDVITNLAFVAAGLHGLWVLRRRAATGKRGLFETGRERAAYILFFAGLAYLHMSNRTGRGGETLTGCWARVLDVFDRETVRFRIDILDRSESLEDAWKIVAQLRQRSGLRQPEENS